VTPAELLQTLPGKATHVLLHELWHCKQLQENRHLVLSVEDAEAEADEFAAANAGLWPDVVTLTDD
jgi:hypothetical protein